MGGATYVLYHFNNKKKMDNQNPKSLVEDHARGQRNAIINHVTEFFFIAHRRILSNKVFYEQ